MSFCPNFYYLDGKLVNPLHVMWLQEEQRGIYKFYKLTHTSLRYCVFHNCIIIRNTPKNSNAQKNGIGCGCCGGSVWCTTYPFWDNWWRQAFQSHHACMYEVIGWHGIIRYSANIKECIHIQLYQQFEVVVFKMLRCAALLQWIIIFSLLLWFFKMSFCVIF